MFPSGSNTNVRETTRHVVFVKALGIDLGGASRRTTGYALMEGSDSPSLEAVGMIEVGQRPIETEVELLDAIDASAPDVLAVDAPLTLPPCLTCPSYCRGPGVDLCEIETAREMWAAGSNPAIRRPCEAEAARLIPGLVPLPTMGLGIITARAVMLVRRLTNRGTAPASMARREVLEVYPRATLARLGRGDELLLPKRRGESETDYRTRVVGGLEGPVCRLRLTAEQRALLSGSGDDGGHALDAVIAAYTGWLGIDRLEPPPEGFNLASGWIWFPR
jgi:predicted nuclease with RNAse H fold